jgi:tryptophan synthase beta chain
VKKGRFGRYGGQYIPETLMNAVQELETAYEYYKNNDEFTAELADLLKNYAGRPSLLYYADQMTRDLGGQNLPSARRFKSHRFAQD